MMAVRNVARGFIVSWLNVLGITAIKSAMWGQVRGGQV